mgnify:CR=1
MQTNFFDLFESSSRSKAWLDMAQEYAIDHAKRHGYVTADDVRKYLPMPDGVDPRVMGALFNRKSFRADGYVKSIRKECHNRPIARFRLANV